MEAMIEYILMNFGVPGMIGVGLYLMINHATKQRKEERDAQMNAQQQRIDLLERSFAKHIDRHEGWEKNVFEEVKKIYERLNPISDSVNRIQGYLEGKNDKG
jgi:hypothetical protein